MIGPQKRTKPHLYENGVWIGRNIKLTELQLDFANFHRCHFQIFCDALHLPRLANSHPAEIWPFERQITVSPASYCFYHAKNFPIPSLKQLPHYEVCKYAVALCVFQAKYRKSNLIPAHLHICFNTLRVQRLHSTPCHQICVKIDETYRVVISEFCIESQM